MSLKVITANDGSWPPYNFSPDVFLLDQPTEDSIRIQASVTAPVYVVTVQPVDSSLKPSGIPTYRVSTENPILVDGLNSKLTYNISIQARDVVGFTMNKGNTQTIQNVTLGSATFNGTIVSSALGTQELKTAKSYFELTYSSNKKNEFAIAYKAFDAINVPVSAQANYPNLPTQIQQLYRTYEDSYYSFGTSLFIDSNDNFPNKSGGLAFFVDDYGKTGYFIVVETLSSSATNDRKSVRILKARMGKMTTLYDSQRTASTTIDPIYGGKAYNIDVKVAVLKEKVIINAYINGLKVTAVDKNSSENVKNLNYVVGPTQNVGVISLRGKTLYDYVYGATILKDKYENSEYNPNIYVGQFSNDTIDVAFGNLLYNSSNAEDAIDLYKSKTAVEEFGSVVREIAHVTPKFDSRPAFPIKWSTGLNEYAKVIGQKSSSFGGEAFVLNNTSTTIPLSDGNASSFYVIGNQLGESGTLEYSTDETDNYVNKEPVIFESTWLQNSEDVKKLANWIKDKVINRGKLINLSVFGNPLISVGDIVTVKYTYQGLAGTEKLIVVSVKHTYGVGLETSIICRTL